MTELLVSAFALMLVIEGILPFTAPRIWREAFRRIVELTDGQLRFAGLASMMTGLYPAGHGLHENGRYLSTSHPVIAVPKAVRSMRAPREVASALRETAPTSPPVQPASQIQSSAGMIRKGQERVSATRRLGRRALA